ncbi:MAG: hypothetical protein Kow0032_03000 [Methyloligellaceae bacterium]
MANRFLTSITRITDLAGTPFELAPLPRGEWQTGDYVACEVIGEPGPLYRIELVSGRRTPVLPGDLLIGALGSRAATHECVGDWRETEEDLRLHQLTGAGLFGKVVSNSRWAGRPMELLYTGHVVRPPSGGKVNIADFVAPGGGAEFSKPVVLVAGTSMSAGKTLTGRAIVHALKRSGFSVTAAKLAGAAGYKDVLSFADAGADHVLDYVDAGLVSTVCAPEDYEAALEVLLAQMAATDGAVAVCEIGASPMEPYNGALALARLAPHVRLFALCASDAYAARGFCEISDLQPDFIAGPAANNTASAALVKKLTGLPALDVSSREGEAALAQLLQDRIAR